MRDYNIKKYEGNTHYSVSVTDSYGRQKGNFFKTKSECHKFIYSVWENEVPKTDIVMMFKIRIKQKQSEVWLT